MFIIVAGPQKSGKSEIAEAEVLKLCKKGKKIYLATMLSLDRESEKRIARHRKMRRGKGFVTVEQPFDILEYSAEDIMTDDTVLLECAANLVANELFVRKVPFGADTAQRLAQEVVCLSQKVVHLVVVTDIFAEKDDYDMDTLEYIRTLNLFNRLIYDKADRVVRVGV